MITYRRHKKVDVDTELSLDVQGVMVVGDWEGDPSIPMGTNELPPYIENVKVYLGKDDVTDWFTEKGLKALEVKLHEDGEQV